MTNRYIFVVGLPRTGTKLTKNVICANPGLLCRLAPESWYLGDLFRSGLAKSIRSMGDMREDENVDHLVHYMYSGRVRGTYWSMLGGKYLDIPKQTMEELLKASDRSERAIYEVIMLAPVVASHGSIAARNAVLGEKMPGNLYHVPQLMDWFPNSRIVHTFRDPRAILASEWRKIIDRQEDSFSQRLARPLKSLSIVLYVTVTWLYAVRLHHLYSQRYPGKYQLVRYEDLVSEPEPTVRKLCEFLEFDFHQAMLQPAKFGSSFTASGGQGFDRQGLELWRRHLAPWMLRWLNLITGSRLTEFGYER
jgi:hypothetical protein